MTKPLLILSDSPLGSTGLGRITRELAERIHANLSNEYQIGIIGVGGTTSSKSPFPIYPVSLGPQWTVPHLPGIWKDFCGDEEGILLTIMNLGWMRWLAHPETLPEKNDLRMFLETAKMKKWAYVPIDAEGPTFRLTGPEASVLEKMDRLLAYTSWGADVIDATLKRESVTPYIPHGIDTSVFRPGDRNAARLSFVENVTAGERRGAITSDVTLIGVVATNSARKDWGLAFQTCQDLLWRGKNIGLWAHTDALTTHWDLLSLAEQTGMRNKTFFTTGRLSNENLAAAYAACDVTLGIGAGEGFGLPIFESLACGVRCIHHNYGGAAEFLPGPMKVRPASYRLDGFYSSRRPVGDPSAWANAVIENVGKTCTLPEQLDWQNVWPKWAAWLTEGTSE